MASVGFLNIFVFYYLSNVPFVIYIYIYILFPLSFLLFPRSFLQVVLLVFLIKKKYYIESFATCFKCSPANRFVRNFN